MTRFAFGLLFVLLTTAPVMAQTQEDHFAACAAKSGKAFQKARDQYLAGKVDEAFLKEKRKSETPWRERLAANILLGWHQHKKEYKELLAAPKQITQSGSQFYVWAATAEGLSSKDIPLMYELLMKEVDPEATFDAARSVLALTARENVPLDVYLLHEFLRDKDGGSASARTAVAFLIGSLPAKYQVAQELQTSLTAELERANKDRTIALSLLEGLGRALSDKNAKAKDGVVGALVTMKGLEELIGKTPLTYALGGIGGDKATEVVAAYLGKTDDQTEKLWALGALSTSGTETGTKILLKYAEGQQLALSKEAIRGLSRVAPTKEVGAKLEALALAEKADPTQQLLAGRTLVQISAKQTKDSPLQKQFQAYIQNISASSPNPQLRQEVKDYLKTLLPR